MNLKSIVGRWIGKKFLRIAMWEAKDGNFEKTVAIKLYGLFHNW